MKTVQHTYEFTQRTTMFFHRLRVPTILTMHVLLGFFCKAWCNSEIRPGTRDDLFTSLHASHEHTALQPSHSSRCSHTIKKHAGRQPTYLHIPPNEAETNTNWPNWNVTLTSLASFIFFKHNQTE